MTIEALISAEVRVLEDDLELLTRRRADGECSNLFAMARHLADSLTILGEDAPQYLQPQIAALTGRCDLLIRSLAH
jgi:hypothetical protein